MAGARGLWLGLDTGGTFTDAVLLEDGRRVVASAKALTTHWNLAIGIGGAIRAVLAALPAGRGRRPERGGIQRALFADVEPEAAAGDFEAARQQHRIDALALEARAEAGVVQTAAAHRPDSRQHVRRAQRNVVVQPLLEQIFDFERQAQQDVTGGGCAGGCGGLQNFLQLVIGERGDHRRREYADRHARLRQCGYGLEAGGGRRRARLETALQFFVEGRHADHHPTEPQLRHVA